MKSLKLMLDRRFVIAETMDPSGSIRSAVATASVDLIVIVKVHLEVTRWGGGCLNFRTLGSRGEVNLLESDVEQHLVISLSESGTKSFDSG